MHTGHNDEVQIPSNPTQRVAIIGGGPAGLMAAEIALGQGLQVDLYEAKGSVGRKFLVAGKGGLNLTHSDPPELFATRYRERRDAVDGWLRDFDASALREWVRGLGVETFTGSSGRVFPTDLKAAPLLRGWVRRLREGGVRFHVHHRWTGWTKEGALSFETGAGAVTVEADATILALGGASWPQLGSDGAWAPLLAAAGVETATLKPSNCGFDIDWSQHLIDRHAGAPLKPVIAHWRDAAGVEHSLQGECVISADGIEGSLVYAASADLREVIERDGHAVLQLDLVPGRSLSRLQHDLAVTRGSRSVSEHLRRNAGVSGVKAALVFEVLDKARLGNTDVLAQTLHRLPLRLLRPRPIAEAISSAGGVRLESMDQGLMLEAMPGVFCAGEMLDWEAPTGGYLLTACFASGRRAALGAAGWLKRDHES